MDSREFTRRVNHQITSVWVKFKINDSDLLGTLLDAPESNDAHNRWVNIEVPGSGRYTVDIQEQITHVGPCGDESAFANTEDVT